MTSDLMRDPLVRSVQWRDLTALSPLDIAKQLLLSAPWLAVSLVLAWGGHYVLALPFSFIFFLTGLRQVHDAYHYALGISRQATELVIFVLSVLMLSSMHAIQLTHLHHHRHCMDEEDVEAMSARMPAWRAILLGPVFPVKLHQLGLYLASPRQRRWIYAELAAMVLLVFVTFFVLHVALLRYHVLAMAVGQCLTAFFAVWTVHHGCDGKGHIARTMRNRIKSVIVFDMFFHTE